MTKSKPVLTTPDPKMDCLSIWIAEESPGQPPQVSFVYSNRTLSPERAMWACNMVLSQLQAIAIQEGVRARVYDVLEEQARADASPEKGTDAK